MAGFEVMGSRPPRGLCPLSLGLGGRVRLHRKEAARKDSEARAKSPGVAVPGRPLAGSRGPPTLGTVPSSRAPAPETAPAATRGLAGGQGLPQGAAGGGPSPTGPLQPTQRCPAHWALRGGGGAVLGGVEETFLSRGQVRGQQHYQDSPAAHLWGKAWREPQPTPQRPPQKRSGSRSPAWPVTAWA